MLVSTARVDLHLGCGEAGDRLGDLSELGQAAGQLHQHHIDTVQKILAEVVMAENTC